jgi:flagellar basal-body rod protein FlgB
MSDNTLQLIAKRMQWLEARQKVLAENIANADTPGYRPNDLKAFDFKEALKSSTSSLSVTSGSLKTTSGAHLNASGTSTKSASQPESKQKDVYETAPAGNAVILEEQLMKMSQNMMDHRLMTTLYQKNIDLMKSSIRSQ